MPTNPFTSSNRRQQILVPKELFPRKNVNVNGETSYRRPIKLPLRKHHSFHFQPSQTVAGASLKHEQFQPKHSNAAHPPTTTAATTKERYKNQGPLVFKPFSEKSAFKPIVPSPKGSNDSDTDGSRTTNGYDASTMPRICGTSLKRHISNVETFSTSNQWQSDTEENLPHSMATAAAATAAATSAGNRRKIHYADLAPLPVSNINSVYHRNDRNNNSNSNESSDNVDSGSGSSSERQMAKINHKSTGPLTTTMAMTPSTANPTTTQYATLRFDEVSI